MAVINNQTLKKRINELPGNKNEAWHTLEEHPQKGEGCINLRVTRRSDGSKHASFVLRYKIKKQGKKYPLGTFLSNGKGQSWAGAREKAEACRVLLRQGIDPLKHFQPEPKATESKPAATLQDVMNLYLAELERKKAADIRNPTSSFKNHVTEAHPDLAKKPAHEVISDDIATIIETMIAKGITTRANRTLSYLTTAYNLTNKAKRKPTTKALITDKFSDVDFSQVIDNPAESVDSNPEFEGVGERALSPSELNRFITGIYPGTGESRDDDRFRLHVITYEAIRFLFAVGGDRMAQILSTPWTQIDIKERMLEFQDRKGRSIKPRWHSVYLNDIAMDVLDNMHKLAPPGKYKYPFPSPGHNNSLTTFTKDEHLRVASINQAIKRFCKNRGMKKWKGSDIRRSCTTLMVGKCKIKESDVAIIQGHTPPNVNRTQKKNYNKYGYWEEKKSALKKWNKFLKKQGF